MREEWSRTQLLLGRPALDRLAQSRVAVFGLGGVGGAACEALARSGVGAFVLVDDDRVCRSNINRQAVATGKTVGRYKAEVMAERIGEINPQAAVQIRREFFLPENAGGFPFQEYDYVIDAVDTVAAKIQLVLSARESGTPVISAMGAGNKLDPGRLRVSDLYETRVCPLARVMRRELRRRGVPSLKVVWSDEEPRRPLADPAAPAGDRPGRRATPGSAVFVPAAAGLLLAWEVVKDLAGEI